MSQGAFDFDLQVDELMRAELKTFKLVVDKTKKTKKGNKKVKVSK